MSTTYSVDLDTGSPDRDALEAAREILDRYYSEELTAIAMGRTSSNTIHVDVSDVELYADESVAQNVASDPKRYNAIFSEAATRTDAVRNTNPSVDARIVDPNGRFIRHLGVSEVNSKHVSEHIAVEGQLSAVTKIRSFPETAAFNCGNCNTYVEVPQNTKQLEYPNGPCECNAAPQWKLNYQESEWVDHRKLKIQQPPEDASNGESQYITMHVFGALCKDPTGNPLVDRAGEDCTAYGTVELRQESGRNSDDYLFNHYLRGSAITFEETGAAAIDTARYEEQVREHATADDVYDRFCTSIAPQIHPTDQMKLAMDVCGAYLFAGPRIDPDDGPMYRGDIHAAIIGDPGMAKSVLLKGVSEFSPDCEHRSATGLASDVGLVAAAVEDDFDSGGWTLKPGILVRAGMHAIIDEIDKGPDKLEKINDALEGRQIASIDKAGMKADLKTRTGLLCSGNPEDSRFDPEQPLPPQIDVDTSLLTRFDAIVMLLDEVDETQDAAIAEHITDSFSEGVEMMKNTDVEPDRTKREVSADVAQAWVTMGRKITPSLPESARERLQEFYVDVRSINDDPETISATARQLEGGIRFAMAFARMRLSETVEEQDVDKAIEVSKALIGQTFDSQDGTFDIDKLQVSSGDSMRTTIKDALDHKDWAYPSQVAKQTNLGENKVRDLLERYQKKNSLRLEEQNGKWRLA